MLFCRRRCKRYGNKERFRPCKKNSSTKNLMEISKFYIPPCAYSCCSKWSSSRSWACLSFHDFRISTEHGKFTTAFLK